MFSTFLGTRTFNLFYEILKRIYDNIIVVAFDYALKFVSYI